MAESLLSVAFFFSEGSVELMRGYDEVLYAVCTGMFVLESTEDGGSLTFAVAARSSRDKSAWARIGIGMPLLLSVLIDLSATMMP